MNWRALVPQRLRQSALWLTLRTARADGMRRSFRRWRIWPRILRTAPVATPPADGPATAEIHLMCFEGDHLAAIRALKSFYRWAGPVYPLMIHLQGPTSRRARRRLATHFPTADVVSQEHADARVEPRLAELGFKRLLEARRAGPMIMKLTDFVLLGRAPQVLAISTAPPRAITRALAGRSSPRKECSA